MEIPMEEHKRLNEVISKLQNDRRPFWNLWRELADYYLPKRYVWLASDKERRVLQAKNPYILDSTGTNAARVLASGMMNGITSPSRPWFFLRVPGYDDDGGPVTQWADEVVRRMMLVMNESNFYNSMAVLYLDLVVFGTAANLIYEDAETVIRCFNPALGEYYLGQSHRLQVDTFAREFCLTVGQVVRKWGIENASEKTKSDWDAGGARRHNEVKIRHIIQPADWPSNWKFTEIYWEAHCTEPKVLEKKGFNEVPGCFPRWELTANDSYGTSPAMDALPDVIQLQLETKRKAQGIDKMINPPIVADIQLQHRPTALMPNGVTFVAGVNNAGVKPLYQIQAPLQEMTEDIREVQSRIRETFHNPLFNMISQLDTVRSASEIEARKEEKLVLLGPVLERFENEALDPAINRIYEIMDRAGLLPEAPPEIEGSPIEIQYVSILSTAQRAVAAIPVERWLGLIGNVVQIAPEVLNVPDFEEIIRDYGLAIGVAAKNMHTREDVAEKKAADQQKQAMAEGLQAASIAADGAQQLSQTDVGGGANALQLMMGN